MQTYLCDRYGCTTRVRKAKAFCSHECLWEVDIYGRVSDMCTPPPRDLGPDPGPDFSMVRHLRGTGPVDVPSPANNPRHQQIQQDQLKLWRDYLNAEAA